MKLTLTNHFVVLGLLCLLLGTGCSQRESIKKEGNTTWATLNRRVDASKDLVSGKINIVYIHADW